MPQYKLINETLLDEILHRYAIGVTVSRLIKDYKLTISGPTLAKYINIYADNKKNSVVTKSLFPDWIDDTQNVTVQPNTYMYVGTFPKGYWHKK